MREQLKTLSKETLVYGLSTVVGRFLNFLLVPFYVNVLRSTAEYGIATSLYTYIGFLNVIYPLGLEGAFFRYGSRAEGESANLDRESEFFSTPFISLLVMGGAFSILINFLAPWAVYPLFHDSRLDISPMVPQLTAILRMGAGILFFDTLTVLPFAVLRLEHQAKRFALIRLSGIILTLILNFVFILGFHWGVTGIFCANLLASIMVFIFLLPTIAERFKWHFSKDVFMKLLPFGLTNVPANLSAMMVQVIDRPIVQAYLGLGVLGIYQANYRMGFIMMVFVSLFEYAWRPFFMRQYLKNDQQARLIFARVFKYAMAFMMVAFLGLSWLLPDILTVSLGGHRLLKETYWSGLPIIPVVLLAYVFQGMYTLFIAGIYIKERNKVLPFVTGLGALVNVLVNIFLIPRIGLLGAALATLMSYIVMALSLYVSSQKVYPVPYNWSQVRRLFLICGCAFFAEIALAHSGMLSSHFATLGVKFGLMGMVICSLFIFGYFNRDERKVLFEKL